MPLLPRLERIRRSYVAGLNDETGLRRHRSAVIFAPHPDDETLGCGGTIIVKRASGVEVACVFMTDGSTSHKKFVSADELRVTRQNEARAATAVLGVNPAAVHFMDYPDGRLAAHVDVATQGVLALLRKYSPEEVYVPYRYDGIGDHEATYAIVRQACSIAGAAIDVCEYPVWLWNRWPWVPLPLGRGCGTLNAIRGAIQARVGLDLMRQFRLGIRIVEVRDVKRRALALHRTQTLAPPQHPEWPVLADVSEGTFLDCFFQDYEVFRCTRIGTVVNRS